jgi:CheY-like chemotaxis protein
MGIGIPEESQHLIFQKFQQLESPLTRKFEGTGLGLVLTQRLAKIHGGDISFISQPNKGSEFTILLPPNSQEKLTDSERNKPNRLVLIVETIPKHIDNLSNLLSELNYKVIVARTGTEALEKARQLKPERIFLNPMLPLLSGWDVLTLLKANQTTQNIPVIITSTPGEEKKAKEQNVEGFLSLPVQKESLRAVLPLNSQSKVEAKKITILYLSSNLDKVDLALKLNSSGLTYRVLEANDLDQAELLARVWGVDLILLQGDLAEDNFSFLELLSQSEFLAKLPLITLDAQITQAALKFSDLSIFPCVDALRDSSIARLLEMINLASKTN